MSLTCYLCSSSTPLAAADAHQAAISAASNGHDQCVFELLDHNLSKRTLSEALEAAAMRNFASCVALLAARVPPAAAGRALAAAADVGHTDCVILLAGLISAGPGAVSMLDIALAKAAAGGHQACMAVCRAWGAADLNGALHVCVRGGGDVREIRTLVAWGASEIRGAFHMAAYEGRRDIVEYLLGCGIAEQDMILAFNAAASSGSLDTLKTIWRSLSISAGGDQILAAGLQAAARSGRATCVQAILGWLDGAAAAYARAAADASAAADARAAAAIRAASHLAIAVRCLNILDAAAPAVAPTADPAASSVADLLP